MYCYVKYSFLVKILVVLSVLQCSEVSGNDFDNANNQRNVLIDKLENALLNNSEQLFTLQKALFLPREKHMKITGLYLNVIVTVVGTVINFNDDTYYQIKDYCRVYFPQNKSCIYGISQRFEISPASSITLTDFLLSQTIVQILTLLDSSYYYLTNALSIVVNDDYYTYDYYYNGGNDYTIYLMIDKINIELNDLDEAMDNVTDALYVTLSRASAYVRNEGIPVQEMLDISWIKDVTNSDLIPQYSVFNMPSTVAGLIFCAYIFLNILILIFTVLNLGKVFEWIKQPQHNHLKDLYKASAIVLTFINFAAFVDVIPIIISLDDISTCPILYLILVFLIFIIDISVSCFNTCKYGCECSKAMHALALCQIIWFVHRLATDAIISIIEFVIAPAQTLGMVTLLLSTVICAILFVSALLRKCQAGCNCKSCSCTKSGTFFYLLYAVHFLLLFVLLD